MNKDKELEEAIIFLMKVAKDYKIYGDLDNPEFEDIKKIPEAIETVIQALKDKENKINKCIEAINELKTGQYIRGAKSYMPSLCCNARLDIIQELLEGR